MRTLLVLLSLAARSLAREAAVEHAECRGYSASNVVTTATSLVADLDLIGDGCALFGDDIAPLRLGVYYESGESLCSHASSWCAATNSSADARLHAVIQDRAQLRYQVPEDVVPRPAPSPESSEHTSQLAFTFTELPFTFQVVRKATGAVLFDTSDSSLIFESQFLRIKTWLPDDPNIYGLGEHGDSFRLPNKNFTRTLWARDSAGIAPGENLYGVHPVWFEQRTSGTHGVLLLNSNGMDVKLSKEEGEKQSMEIITIGGILDFYFMAGPSPVEVAQQYSEVVGAPAMVPYWSLGFHQCKFGYQDWFEVAEVITNYSAADIPLETMWTDIDYMDGRKVFTFDPDRFPVTRMREIVHYLHSHQQQFMLMVDPAVGRSDYPAFNAGKDLDVFVKVTDDKYFEGVVWPGVTVYPDWYHPNVLQYWTEQFQKTFNPETGVDIDGVWIDMNEPTNFCRFPCADPDGEAKRIGTPPTPPPVRDPPRPLPGFNVSHSPSLPHVEVVSSLGSQRPLDQHAQRSEHTRGGQDFIHPPYKINNANKHTDISEKTIRTDLLHANGLLEYDIHSLYGTTMGITTRRAMLARRPSRRPFIISRSTFAGAGRHMQKWLGDNASRWAHYRASIAGMLNFAALFQIPLVGSDVCGFQDATTEELCARWATLGAFTPFFRNHADEGTPPQEFYRWDVVAGAARWAIAWRYRLLDYFYTALRRQSVDGTPALNPLWFVYPGDERTYCLDLQYFYGSCLLVSPVTAEGSTSVEAYFPDDVFYELETGKMLRGRGDYVKIEDVPLDRIPLHVRGGCAVPLRVESAKTTTELRKKGFEVLVAPGLDGLAAGSLYADDGITLDGGADRLEVIFQYENGKLYLSADDDGSGLGLDERMKRAGIKIERVRVLGGDESHDTEALIKAMHLLPWSREWSMMSFK